MKRNNFWDWLKVVAFVAMVGDHLRFVFPDLEWLMIPGRLALPLFGFVVARTFEGKETGPFLLRLLKVGIVAELPYWAVTGSCGNILLLFVFALYSARRDSLLGWIGAACCGYGIPGAVMVWGMCFFRSQAACAGLSALVNPFPLSLVSACAGWSAAGRFDCVPAPGWVRLMLWLYPAHLSVLLGMKIAFMVL